MTRPLGVNLAVAVMAQLNQIMYLKLGLDPLVADMMRHPGLTQLTAPALRTRE
jgi:hypothetical protein